MLGGVILAGVATIGRAEDKPSDMALYATAKPRPLDLTVQALNTARETAEAVPLAGTPTPPQVEEPPANGKKRPPPASVKPMFRQTDESAEPNAKGDFFDRHQFGILINQPL